MVEVREDLSKEDAGYAGATSEFHDNLWAKEEDCDFLYEANTNKPSLVTSVCFTGLTTLQIADDGLSVLSCQIKEEKFIHWNDALEIFKNYLRIK